MGSKLPWEVRWGPFNPKPALPGPSLYPKAKRKKEKYNQAVEFIISHVCASLVFFFVFLGARLLISILPLLPLFSLAGTFYPSCSSAHCRIVIRLLNQKRPPFHRPILFIVSFFCFAYYKCHRETSVFFAFFPLVAFPLSVLVQQAAGSSTAVMGHVWVD